MGVFSRGTHIVIDLSVINPPDSAWFSRALKESFQYKAGKKSNQLRTELHQIYLKIIIPL